ncbi:MAG: hypothetical protein ACR5K4_02550 [Sodalis sp. (in: enterobacteria)]
MATVLLEGFLLDKPVPSALTPASSYDGRRRYLHRHSTADAYCLCRGQI